MQMAFSSGSTTLWLTACLLQSCALTGLGISPQCPSLDIVMSVPFSWPGPPQDPVQVSPLEKASPASPAWVFGGQAPCPHSGLLALRGQGSRLSALLILGPWIPKHLGECPKEILPHVPSHVPRDA